MKLKVLLLLLIFLFCTGLCIYLFNLYTDHYFNQQKITYQKDLDMQLDKLFKGTNKIVEAKMLKYYPDTIRLDNLYFPKKKSEFNPFVCTLPESDGFALKRKFLYQKLEYNDIEDLEVLWEIWIPTSVWEIEVLEKTESGYYTQYKMMPLAVGYKKLVDRNEEKFRPSLYVCCKNAYKYLIENNEEIKYFYTPSQTIRIVKFKSVDNKYYHVDRLRDNDWTLKKPIYQYYENDPKKINYLQHYESLSCIFSYYDKIFYAKTKTNYYNFYFDEISFNNDKKNYLNNGFKIIFIIIFIIFILPLFIIIKKNKKNKPKDISN